MSNTADESDLVMASRTIAEAFRDDPVWGSVLESGHLGADTAELWRFFLLEARRSGTLHMTGERADAVAVWIAPGHDEITAGDTAALRELIARRLPDRVALVDQLFEVFEKHRPTEPHAYLSLLATHPRHRGRGIAQEMLRADLAIWDAREVPTYLESSNPANDHRYARLGYRARERFLAPASGAPVTTMWRAIGGGEP